MIAAIYARKSTDQNVADEAKSVTRQVESARAYAARKGWTVAESTSTSTMASRVPSTSSARGSSV
jgi:DNA invertase Pin-like site-specific DNA recombinase